MVSRPEEKAASRKTGHDSNRNFYACPDNAGRSHTGPDTCPDPGSDSDDTITTSTNSISDSNDDDTSTAGRQHDQR